MLVFYCCFEGGWSGSVAMLVMLDSVSTYKEQLVDYDGGLILKNMRNLSVQTVLYFLYGVFYLFNSYKKCH